MTQPESEITPPPKSATSSAFLGGARALGISVPIAGVLFLIALSIANSQEGYDGIGTFILALFGLPILVVVSVVVGAVRGGLTRERPEAAAPHASPQLSGDIRSAGYAATAIGALVGSILSFPALILMIYLIDFAAPESQIFPVAIGAALMAGLTAAGVNYILRRNQHERAFETSLLVFAILGTFYLAISLLTRDGNQTGGALLKLVFFSAPLLAGIVCRGLALRIQVKPHRQAY